MSGKAGHRGWGWIRKRSSGRYQASYIGPDQKRHSAPRTFKDKMDAEEWLSQERKAIENATDAMRTGRTKTFEWVSPKIRELTVAAMLEQDKTIEQYGKQWIEQRNLKPRTVVHYSNLLGNHIAPKIGTIPVRALNAATVRNWYATTLTDKPVMRSHAYQLLHAICKTAVADELLPKNPCMIEGASNAKTTTKAGQATVDQIGQVIGKLPAKYQALVVIAAWCGLRWGEVSELRRKDVIMSYKSDGTLNGCAIHLTRNAVHITAKQAAEHGFDRCQINTERSNKLKPRTVPAPEHFWPIIEHHLTNHVEREPDALLFPPVRKGCHLVEKVFRDEYRKACAAVGITLRIHDMRHFAGEQTARVANLVETMDRLGHTTQSASLRYQHVVSGRNIEVTKGLSDLAAGSAKPADEQPN